MNYPDWESEAHRALVLVHDRLTEAHRGALIWHEPTDTLLAFANDGYPQEHIKFMREKLADYGVHIWSVAANEYSFVMLMDRGMLDVDDVTDGLWGSWWNVSHGTGTAEDSLYENAQRQAAAERIERFTTGLEHPWETE